MGEEERDRSAAVLARIARPDASRAVSTAGAGRGQAQRKGGGGYRLGLSARVERTDGERLRRTRQHALAAAPHGRPSSTAAAAATDAAASASASASNSAAAAATPQQLRLRLRCCRRLLSSSAAVLLRRRQLAREAAGLLLQLHQAPLELRRRVAGVLAGRQLVDARLQVVEAPQDGARDLLRAGELLGGRDFRLHLVDGGHEGVGADGAVEVEPLLVVLEERGGEAAGAVLKLEDALLEDGDAVLHGGGALDGGYAPLHFSHGVLQPADLIIGRLFNSR
jgi:hypothetical protein